jgi:hypothetical protein
MANATPFGLRAAGIADVLWARRPSAKNWYTMLSSLERRHQTRPHRLVLYLCHVMRA